MPDDSEPGAGPAPFLRPVLARPRLWLVLASAGLVVLLIEWIGMWFWASADVARHYEAAGFVDDGGLTGDVEAIKLAFERWAVVVAVELLIVVVALILRRRGRNQADQ